MKLKTKKKSRLEQKEKSISNKEGHSVPPSNINKKALEELKAAYKSRLLSFDSEEIAKTILEDKDLRRGLTK